MEKTEIVLEQVQKQPATFRHTTQKQKIQKHHLPWRIITQYSICWLVSFLWSRSTVLQILHPLGMSVLSAFFGSGNVFWFVLTAVFCGSFGNGVFLKNMAVWLAAALLHMTLGRFLTKEETWKKALLGGFAMALGGSFYAVSQGGLQFYFVVAFVESMMVIGMALLLQKGILVLTDDRKVMVVSNEEMLSVLLLLGGALAGISRIGIPYLENTIFPFLTTLLILIAAYREGVGGGASVGVMVGFLLYVTGGADLAFVAILGFGGWLVGCLKDIGRWAAASAFLFMAMVFLFYTKQAYMDWAWLPCMAVAGIVFCCVPQKIWLGCVRETIYSKDHFFRMRQDTEEKLKGFGMAFHGLAKTFVVEQQTEPKEVSRLVDCVAEKVCKNCGLAHSCWQEEVYRTYSMTMTALSVCDTKGFLTMEQMPQWFLEVCPRKKEYVSTICAIYAQHRHDMVWAGRLQECRELVQQQLDAVGGILENMAGNLDTGCVYLEPMQDALLFACKKAGIRIQDAVVTEDNGSRGKKVVLCVKGCNGRGICKEQILPLVKKIVGRYMVQQNPDICHMAGGVCTVVFKEEPLYALTVATACAAGQMGKQCGDATAYLESDKGVAMMAISDGMGMGERASAESSAAMELLEQFSEAGFPKETAVKLINSALLLRRAEENYATLDICSIDLYDGYAEFIKLGAVASFICRGERVISVYTHSLPAGILQQVQVQKNDMRLKDGDMILLLTDGITDAFGGEQKTATWLEEIFLPQTFTNPQNAADFILQQAKKAGGTDDMTVQAARFWQKVV